MAESADNSGSGDGGNDNGGGAQTSIADIAGRLQGDFDRVFQGQPLDKGGTTDNRRATPRQSKAPAGRQQQRRNLAPPPEHDDPELEGVADQGDDDKAGSGQRRQAPTQRQQAAQPQRRGGQQIQQPAPQDGGADDGVDDGQQADDAPTVHPILLDAARRSGWSDEDIDAHIDSVGDDRAAQDFMRLHDSLNSVAAAFGRFGGAQVNGGGQVVPPQQRAPQGQPNAQQSHADLLGQVFGEDAERFDEVYGEGFTDRVLKPILDTVIAPVQRMQAEAHQREAAALAGEVHSFFDTQKEFAKLYGAGNVKTREQAEARFNVGQLADQIRSGAMMQGYQMPVKEALDLAHRQFITPHLQEQMRKRLTDSIRSRSSRITARPTNRNSAAPQPGQAGGKNKANAVSAVAQAMDELGFAE